MKQNLTLKERRFLESYLNGDPLHVCAKSYGSHAKDKHSLATVALQILKKLDISMEDTLTLGGVTDHILSEKVQEALSANKRYFGTWQGEVIEGKEFPDYTNRLKAVEIAGRMKGVFLDRQEITGKDGGDISITYASSKIGKGKGKVQFDL